MMYLVDSNEKATSERTIKELEQVFEDIIISKLQSGDFNAILEDGSILSVERKTVFDFLGSIGDGRLFKQVENMATHAKYYAVVIEGHLGFNKEDMTIADGQFTNWRGVAVRAALFTVMWSGCPIFFCPPGSYPFILEELVKITNKTDKRFQRNHQRIITFPPLDTEVDILMAFPNIGQVRAESLMDFAKEDGRGGTLVGAFCWAAAFPLIKGGRPKGWGNAMVNDFRKTLGLEKDEYLEIKKYRKVEEEDEKVILPEEDDIPF